MTAKNPHRYPCPTCDRECVSDAAWRARNRMPCLACTRRENGWTHDEDCPTHDDSHRGVCSSVAR